MFNLKNFIIIFLVVVALVLGGVLVVKFLPVEKTNTEKANESEIDYNSQIDKETPVSEILRYNDKEVLQIYTPYANKRVLSPLAVKGLAPSSWFFEASFPMKLLSSDGKELGVGVAQATEEWTKPGLIRFIGTIIFTSPSPGENGTLVFSADNSSGLPQYEKSVSMPVKFYPDEESLLIKIFFSNEKMNPGIMDCSLVFPVERLIDKTPAVGAKALELLLAGPYMDEKQAGYTTSLNEGVKLLSLKITDGIAYADFDETLEKAVGGSCRTAMIIAQIRETLKQFPTVKDVVISINGQTEAILQP